MGALALGRSHFRFLSERCFNPVASVYTFRISLVFYFVLFFIFMLCMNERQPSSSRQVCAGLRSPRSHRRPLLGARSQACPSRAARVSVGPPAPTRNRRPRARVRRQTALNKKTRRRGGEGGGSGALCRTNQLAVQPLCEFLSEARCRRGSGERQIIRFFTKHHIFTSSRWPTLAFFNRRSLKRAAFLGRSWP